MDMMNISAMDAAQRRMQVAGHNLANQHSVGHQALQASQYQANDAVRVEISQSGKSVNDIQEVINLSKATYDFKANALVLRNQEEMQRTLLEVWA